MLGVFAKPSFRCRFIFQDKGGARVYDDFADALFIAFVQEGHAPNVVPVVNFGQAEPDDLLQLCSFQPDQADALGRPDIEDAVIPLFGYRARLSCHICLR
jgi:hypothetical protein